MTVYIAGRQTGKTVFLIQQSARTGAVIVAPTYQMVGYIDRMARRSRLPLLSLIGFEASSASAKTVTKPIWLTSSKWC